jgi:hypothetical protein
LIGGDVQVVKIDQQFSTANPAATALYALLTNHPISIPSPSNEELSNFRPPTTIASYVRRLPTPWQPDQRRQTNRLRLAKVLGCDDE